MSHVPEGTLRRLLDEPAAISHDGRDHVAGCRECDDRLGEVTADRDDAARRLAVLDAVSAEPTAVAVDEAVDAAWARLQAGLTDPDAGRSAPLVPVRMRRGRRDVWRAGRPIAAAVTAAAVVFGGTAAAAAADWLPFFRTESVRPVALTGQDLRLVDQLGGLSDLAAYGTVVSAGGDVATVADAATAAARTGLTVPRVTSLPRGVEGTPSYQVMSTKTLEFTFSAAKARTAAATSRAALPPVPPSLDGTRLRVQGGPGVALTWKQAGTIPALLVVRAKAPTAQSEGASLPVVRDYLLSIPGISPALAAQLRSVTGEGTTLPIPVPEEVATASQTDLGGVPATVIETKGRTAVGVVWVENGELDGVLGPLGRDEVLAVARGLR